MLGKSPYTTLRKDDFTEYDTPILSDADYHHTEKRTTLYIWFHWAFHLIASCVIVGLSAGLYSATKTSQIKCWDMFNFYCKSY